MVKLISLIAADNIDFGIVIKDLSFQVTDHQNSLGTPETSEQGVQRTCENSESNVEISISNTSQLLKPSHWHNETAVKTISIWY